LINDYKSHGNPAADREDFNRLLVHNVIYFIYLAIGGFVLIYIVTVGFIYTSTHITSAVRKEYFAALLRQNITFLDNVGTGENPRDWNSPHSRYESDIKIACTLTGLAILFAAFVVGFVEYR
jgi:ATP-binding cassette subfamily B (MDR/TAP) protein 1